MTQRGRPEHAQCSRVWNLTTGRFGAAGGVVDQQQNIGLLLRQEDRGALTGVDMLEGRVVLTRVNRPHMKPFAPCANPIKHLERSATGG